MILYICLGCRSTVMCSTVPRQCKKCHATSAWFKEYEPRVSTESQPPQVVNGIKNGHPTAG